jgi:hypothetical protein
MYRKKIVMAMPLLAAIAFSIQGQTAKKLVGIFM